MFLFDFLYGGRIVRMLNQSFEDVFARRVFRIVSMDPLHFMKAPKFLMCWFIIVLIINSDDDEAFKGY